MTKMVDVYISRPKIVNNQVQDVTTGFRSVEITCSKVTRMKGRYVNSCPPDLPNQVVY
jgi:hypothetical protein